MLDNNLIGYYTLYSTSNILFFNPNNKYCIILSVSPYGLMQGCTPEWRTNFQREATTEDSKRGQSRNSGPENFVHPPFKISGSAPGVCYLVTFKNNSPKTFNCRRSQQNHKVHSESEYS